MLTNSFMAIAELRHIVPKLEKRVFKVFVKICGICEICVRIIIVEKNEKNYSIYTSKAFGQG